MSNWLSSVNNLLESLDDRVEIVASTRGGEEDDEDFVEDGDDDYEEDDSVEEDEEDEEEDDDDDEYEGDEEDYEDEQEDQEEDGDAREEEEQDPEEEEEEEDSNRKEGNLQAPLAEKQGVGDFKNEQQQMVKKSKDNEGDTVTTSPPSAPAVTAIKVAKASAAPKSGASGTSKSSSKKKKSTVAAAPTSSGSATTNAELQRLQRANRQLQARLDAATAELDAQQKELVRAGERMERERKRMDEEREDLLDEQEEELQQVKEQYETTLAQQKQDYLQQLEDVQQRLHQEEQKRLQEDGDWTQELEEALQRERDALKRLSQVSSDKSALEYKVAQLELQQASLTSKIENLHGTAKAATDRERQAQDRLDAALAAHSRQLAQRQAREAALERSVNELGAALSRAATAVAAQQQRDQQNSGSSTAMMNDNNNNKEQGKDLSYYSDAYHRTQAELESVQTELTLSNERYQALHEQFRVMTTESLADANQQQERQRAAEEKVTALTSHLSRLQNTLRREQRKYKQLQLKVQPQQAGDVAILSEDDDEDDPEQDDAANPTKNHQQRVQQLLRDADDAKRQVATLSDQLLRQQGINEASKSEIMVLKGKLQAANSRADAAEEALHQLPLPPPSSGNNNSSVTGSAAAGANAGYYDLESGYKMRKRVKGGGVGGVRSRNNPYGKNASALQTRSIRSALGWRVAQGSNLEPVALTLDTVDSWLVDGGTMLRHEPLTRLGFAMYLTLIHLWCFGLVFFHAVQSEHGDLGELTSPRHVVTASLQRHSTDEVAAAIGNKA